MKGSREVPLWLAPLMVAMFIAAYALVMTYSTPFGLPPDERAHWSYIMDAMESERFLPDYLDGDIRGADRKNYLVHPPLYYTVGGLVGMVTGASVDEDFRVFRILSVLFFGGGLFLILWAAARRGVSVPALALLGLGTGAVPMFAYLAGSINNDGLAYLAVGMVFLAFALAREDRDTWVPHAWLLFGGLTIAFLTKMNAAAFLSFLVAAMILLRFRDLPAMFRRWDLWVAGTAFVIVVGGYYLWIRAHAGGFFPRPEALYTAITLQDPMSFRDYAKEFFGSMWRRLPVAMSHMSVGPYPDALVRVFFAAVFFPPLTWAVLRVVTPWRTQQRARVVLADAVMLALLASLTLHFLVAYRGYLETGLLGALQPRYYIYMIPLLWVPAFLVMREGWIQTMATVLFGILVLASFWGSVTFFQQKQYEGLLEMRPPTAFAGVESKEKREASLLMRGEIRGHVDNLRLENGSLFVRGWAFDSDRTERPLRIVVLGRGVFMGAGVVDNLRTDVARALGTPRARNAGFALRIWEIPQDIGPCDLSVLAEFPDGSFSEIPVANCEEPPY